MTLHHLIVTFKTLGAYASLEPRYCRIIHCVASCNALALATTEVLGLSLPRHFLPTPASCSNNCQCLLLAQSGHRQSEFAVMHNAALCMVGYHTLLEG